MKKWFHRSKLCPHQRSQSFTKLRSSGEVSAIFQYEPIYPGRSDPEDDPYQNKGFLRTEGYSRTALVPKSQDLRDPDRVSNQTRPISLRESSESEVILPDGFDPVLDFEHKDCGGVQHHSGIDSDPDGPDHQLTPQVER